MEKKFYHKKRWWIILAISIGFISLILFRSNILTAIGYYLVADDDQYESPVFAVLGGNSAERGRAAAWLAEQHPSAHFLVTGGNRPSQLAAIGIITTEADLTKKRMVHLGIDSTRITALETGTSSKEEADLLLDYCKKHQIPQITIVSGQYHLRRLRRTFEPAFEESNIGIRFFGAIEKDFDPEHWWQSESGLIYTNNEYIKILYYWLKY
ncbi:MAG: hypothetical protein RLY35_2135 [Bacteroidota bacterium]|jgi:uncharacterized SAM-binding protein YcdF (DUF218 family)